MIAADLAIESRGFLDSAFGRVERILIYSREGRKLLWPEICAAFNERYPGRWAIQLFPPAEMVADTINHYHLFILESAPWGLDIWGRLPMTAKPTVELPGFKGAR